MVKLFLFLNFKFSFSQEFTPIDIITNFFHIFYDKDTIAVKSYIHHELILQTIDNQ
jgi:hypothetical protein